jgi:hypothetical protein
MVVYSCKKCDELNYLSPHAFWNITNFDAKCVPFSGHWIAEERPDFLVKELVKFFGE